MTRTVKNPMALKEFDLPKTDFEWQLNSQHPLIGDEFTNMLKLYQRVQETSEALKEKWTQKNSENKLMRRKHLEISNENAKYVASHKKTVMEIEALLSETQNCKKKSIEVKALIQQQKDELAMKKEMISAANKANKASLKELNKAADVFKDRLGLEIRKIQGEQLQFIFRSISHKDPELAYTFTLKINDNGDYEVTSCDPPLECMPLLEQKVRETNNFSAFLANIRKAFLQL